MLADYTQIKNSKTFPLDKIIAVLDRFDNRFAADKAHLDTFKEEDLVNVKPIFHINNTFYISAHFGGYKDHDNNSFKTLGDYYEVLQKFSQISLDRHANPIQLKLIPDNRQSLQIFGLIPYLFDKTVNLMMNTKTPQAVADSIFNEMVLAASELEPHKLINIDFHTGNLIYSKEKILVIILL